MVEKIIGQVRVGLQGVYTRFTGAFQKSNRGVGESGPCQNRAYRCRIGSSSGPDDMIESLFLKRKTGLKGGGGVVLRMGLLHIYTLSH